MTRLKTQQESTNFVKLDRCILELGFPAVTLGLYSHCLMRARYKPKVAFNMTIQIGQFVTTNKELEDTLQLTKQVVRSALKSLEKSKLISIKTTNKFTLITICNHSENDTPKMGVQQTNNKQITNKKQTNNTLNKKEGEKKEEKREESIIGDAEFFEDEIDFRDSDFEEFEEEEEYPEDHDWTNPDAKPLLPEVPINQLTEELKHLWSFYPRCTKFKETLHTYSFLRRQHPKEEILEAVKWHTSQRKLITDQDSTQGKYTKSLDTLLNEKTLFDRIPAVLPTKHAPTAKNRGNLDQTDAQTLHEWQQWGEKAKNKPIYLSNVSELEKASLVALKKGGIIWGGVGSGKTTTLKKIIANQGVEKAFFIQWPKFYGEMLEKQRSNNPNEYGVDAIINMLVKKESLVIDEVALGNATPAELKMLYRIVDGRYNADQKTVLITNYGPARLQTESGIGVQVFDRIMGQGVAVLCDWESLRGK